MSHLANAGSLLLDVIFGLAALLFALRLLLQWVAAPFQNPICQSIYRLTNPALMPLRRLLKPWRKIDLAAGSAALITMLIKAALLLALWHLPISLTAVLILGVAELLALMFTLWFWLILIRVILSWVGSDAQHPAIPLIIRLTEPLLGPVRRALPNIGGFDLSPMLVILMLVLARILVVAPLQELALLVASGAAL